MDDTEDLFENIYTFLSIYILIGDVITNTTILGPLMVAPVIDLLLAHLTPHIQVTLLGITNFYWLVFTYTVVSSQSLNVTIRFKGVLMPVFKKLHTLL